MRIGKWGGGGWEPVINATECILETGLAKVMKMSGFGRRPNRIRPDQ